MPESGRQVSPEQQAVLLKGAQRSRPIPNSPPADAFQARRHAALRANRVLIRGRLDKMGREVWDVIKLQGGRAESVEFKGCVWKEEAVELAAEVLRGRVVVSIAGARTLLRQSGSLLAPLSTLDKRPLVLAMPRDGKTYKTSHEMEVQLAPVAKPAVS